MGNKRAYVTLLKDDVSEVSNIGTPTFINKNVTLAKENIDNENKRCFCRAPNGCPYHQTRFTAIRRYRMKAGHKRFPRYLRIPIRTAWYCTQNRDLSENTIPCLSCIQFCHWTQCCSSLCCCIKGNRRLLSLMLQILIFKYFIPFSITDFYINFYKDNQMGICMPSL